MDRLEQSRPSWDDYFMNLAEESAKRSKDPTTKVGACIVKDKRVLSLGYNGAPRNYLDDLINWSSDTTSELEDQKYPFIVHGELNAILNFKGSLSELEGATIYVTVSPCYDCAKALAQVGIKEVIYKSEYHRSNIWKVSKLILDRCGVKCRKL